MTIGQRSDLLKYESVQSILEGLGKNQKELKGRVQEVEERVKQLEDIMGVEPPLPHLK